MIGLRAARGLWGGENASGHGSDRRMALTVDARVDNALKAAQERRKWIVLPPPQKQRCRLGGERGLWNRLEWLCISRQRSGGGAPVLAQQSAQPGHHHYLTVAIAVRGSAGRGPKLEAA